MTFATAHGLVAVWFVLAWASAMRLDQDARDGTPVAQDMYTIASGWLMSSAALLAVMTVVRVVAWMIE